MSKVKSHTPFPACSELSGRPLIYSSDIAALQKKQNLTAGEVTLLQQAGMSESNIQSRCKSITQQFDLAISQQHPGARAIFVQFDNGGNLTDLGRIRKAREGTLAGMTDAVILFSIPSEGVKPEPGMHFVEFKRIGNKSQIEPSDEQKRVHEMLRSIGADVTVTNSIPYFKEHVLGSILNKIKS